MGLLWHLIEAKKVVAAVAGKKGAGSFKLAAVKKPKKPAAKKPKKAKKGRVPAGVK